VVVIDNAQHTGALPGRVLRRSADGSVGFNAPANSP